MSDLILSVAIPRPVEGLYTYRLPSEMIDKVKVGGWVKVPFGRGATHAYVVEAPKLLSELPHTLKAESLKAIREVGTNEWVLPEDVLSLCRFASEYYAAPLGEVLNAAAPAAAMGLRSKRTDAKALKVAKDPIVHRTSPLTGEQQTAVDAIEAAWAAQKTAALLRGVTGSGKTEVYLELARRVLAAGKGVLVLVPEIALTSQLHERFESGLGERVALWHSALPDGQRRDLAAALVRGELRVVVGARSAVFAPVMDLGLIVVDEEHDSTYKQDDRVRYNARDLAVVRGTRPPGPRVLLGSATPSLESLERVREGRYGYAELSARYAQATLPEIELVDLTQETLEPMPLESQAIFAQKTLDTIRSTLALGQQVMIFLNRRGFASFMLCEECGAVSECPNCSISMTVHRHDRELRCHYCDERAPLPNACKKCHGNRLRPMGIGTEGLEVDLAKLLPGVSIERLDRDQITSATRLDKVLNAFRRGETQVMIGTQMLVKGHDFPNVTLVVVMLADSLFRWPDFRAAERAYQILRQVSGRAGRGDKPGRVLVQTYDPSHPVLDVLSGIQSEDGFLTAERELRQALGYPPFARMVRVRFEDANQKQAFERAKTAVQFCEEAKISDRLEILGPSEAFIERLKGLYRWDVLLRARDVRDTQKAVQRIRWLCHQNRWPFWVDVDPYSS